MLIFFLSCALDIPESFIPSENAKNLLFITHGSGDSIDDWPLEISEIMESNIIDPNNWDIWRYDWKKDSENKLFAAGNAVKHGEQIVDFLHSTDYEHYHLMAHSAGSFIIHTLEQELFEQATIHSTYLDPFCGSNIVDWEYGHRRFGEFAQFSEAYINMDDGVPSTDSALQQSFVFDITALTPDTLQGSERHWWPIQVYQDSIQAGVDWGYGNTVEAGNTPYHEHPSFYPKGGITTLE